MGRASSPGISAHFVAALLLLLFALSSPLSAQEAESRTGVWLTAGLGSAQLPSGEGGAGVGQLSFQHDEHLIAARILLIGDLFDSSDNAFELGALYGRVKTTEWIRGSVAGGVAMTSVACDGASAGSENCLTIGLPIVAEASLRASVIGLGLQGFVNLNPKSVFGGAVAFLQFGWIP